MQLTRKTAPLLGLATLAALGLAAAPAAATVASQVTHVDSGTSIAGYSGSQKTGQFLRFDLLADNPGGTTTITADNFVYSGPWQITFNDALGAAYSPGVVLTPNYSDYKSSTVTIPTTLNDNYLQLPVTEFGDGLAFDLTLTGTVTTTFDYKIYAQDDPTELADLQYTRGSSTPTLIYAAPGASVTGNVTAAPEPPAFAALGIGILGLGALALRARKRRAA